MQAYTLNEWIEPLASKVEEHLVLATRVYQNLTEEQLLAPATDGGWSVAQCLEHLNSYGHYYLPAVEKALDNRQVSDGMPREKKYRSGWFGDYFIRMMQPGSTKKYKAFKGHIPSLQPDGTAVVAEFIEQQEHWLRLLRRVSQVDQLTYRVPISISQLIRLKLGDVLGFVKAHDDRHIQQANRVLHHQQKDRTEVRS